MQKVEEPASLISKLHRQMSLGKIFQAFDVFIPEERQTLGHLFREPHLEESLGWGSGEE
jgi:hypothetical protein